MDCPEARGEQIPGSRYLRDFCHDCGAPMRVTCIDFWHWCETCDPKPPKTSAGSGPRPDDVGPWYEQAVRAMEDG